MAQSGHVNHKHMSSHVHHHRSQLINYHHGSQVKFSSQVYFATKHYIETILNNNNVASGPKEADAYKQRARNSAYEM